MHPVHVEAAVLELVASRLVELHKVRIVNPLVVKVIVAAFRPPWSPLFVLFSSSLNSLCLFIVNCLFPVKFLFGTFSWWLIDSIDYFLIGRANDSLYLFNSREQYPKQEESVADIRGHSNCPFDGQGHHVCQLLGREPVKDTHASL